MPVSLDLRRLFTDLPVKQFPGESEMASYIAELLTRFVHADNLYRIRNSRGKHLEEVGERLLESNPLLDAPSYDRERVVRKHIGDYTLFLTGLFPEYVAALPRRGLWLDSIVAALDQFEYRGVAPLFRRLAEQFE